MGSTTSTRRPDLRSETKTMLKAVVAAGLLSLGLMGTASAQICSSYPYNLANGTTADASQLMANFSCAATLGSPHFNGIVGIGTANPGMEAANARLAILGTAGQTAVSLAQSNANAVMSLRAD